MVRITVTDEVTKSQSLPKTQLVSRLTYSILANINPYPRYLQPAPPQGRRWRTGFCRRSKSGLLQLRSRCPRSSRAGAPVFTLPPDAVAAACRRSLRSGAARACVSPLLRYMGMRQEPSRDEALSRSVMAAWKAHAVPMMLNMMAQGTSTFCQTGTRLSGQASSVWVTRRK